MIRRRKKRPTPAEKLKAFIEKLQAEHASELAKLRFELEESRRDLRGAENAADTQRERNDRLQYDIMQVHAIIDNLPGWTAPSTGRVAHPYKSDSTITLTPATRLSIWLAGRMFGDRIETRPDVPTYIGDYSGVGKERSPY